MPNQGQANGLANQVGLGKRPDAAAARSAPRPPGLNSKYTFETFAIGSSNRFAHAAGAFAEAPARPTRCSSMAIWPGQDSPAIGHYAQNLPGP